MTTDINQILWKLKNDSRYFKETQLKIKSQGQIIPLRLNKAQLKIQAQTDRLKAENKPVRLIILKSRQVGVSTNTEADIYHATTTRPNISSMVIAHDAESTKHLLRMFKLFWDTQDTELRPMRKYSTRNEVVFENPNEKLKIRDPGLRSYIRVDTAGNPNAGRAFSIDNLHISELAFWQNPEEVMTGLMQSVSDRPDTMIVIESTANGMNYFHQMWRDAENGDSDFVPVFIGWHEDDNCRKEAPADFEPYDYEHELFSNEAQLAIKYGLDNEQLYWRRWAIRNKANNDIDKFHQEYPANAQEAFLVTGRNVFNMAMIQQYYDFIREPERGEFDVKTEYKTFNTIRTGNLRIWEHPTATNRYSVGVDVAEGFAGGDFSCAEVLDVRNYEQVAEWHGHMGQEEFAAELIRLGKYYNSALLVIESNQGQVVLSHLKHYPRLYYRRKVGMRGEAPTNELGFRTTQKTKGILIGTFKKLFEEEELIINGRELLREMSTYVEEEPDKDKPRKVLSTGAASKKDKDDRVIAACLAVVGLQGIPVAITQKTRREPSYKPANPLTGY